MKKSIELLLFKDFIGITGVFRSEKLFNIKAKFYNVDGYPNEYDKESLPDVSLN